MNNGPPTPPRRPRGGTPKQAAPSTRDLMRVFDKPLTLADPPIAAPKPTRRTAAAPESAASASAAPVAAPVVVAPPAPSGKPRQLSRQPAPKTRRPITRQPAPPPKPQPHPTVEQEPALAAESLGRGAQYPSRFRWLTAGFKRYPKATSIALLLGWTGSIAPVWAGLIVGVGLAVAIVFVGIFHIGTIGSVMGYAPSGALVSGGVVAAVVGACLTFLVGYVVEVLGDPSRLLLTLLAGAAVTTLIVATYGSFEETVLRLSGYRRLSREEGELIAPLLQDAADKLNLGTLPRVAIHDDKMPRAFAGVDSIVLSAGMLEMLKSTPNELEAVIAHELAHWTRADAVGRIFITAAGWPMLVLYEIGSYIGRAGINKSRLLLFFGFALSFPAKVLINAVLVPVLRKESREAEYAADALVKEAGLGDALAKALLKLGIFESGISGWSQKFASTHPPIALRRERLGDYAPDDAYLDEDLGAGDLRRLRSFGDKFTTSVLAPMLLVVIALLGIGHLPWRHAIPFTQYIPVPLREADPVTYGQPNAQDGAVAAAVALTVKLCGDTNLADMAADLKSSAAPGYADQLAGPVEKVTGVDTSRLRSAGNAVAYKVTTYSAHAATVAVWYTVDIVGPTGEQRSWSTATTDLVWNDHGGGDGAWLVTNLQGGPSTISSTPLPAPDGFTPLGVTQLVVPQ